MSMPGTCAPEELDELELELLLLEDELLDELEELLELELEELDEPLGLLLPLSPPPQPVKTRQSSEIAQPDVRRDRSMIHKQRKDAHTSATIQPIRTLVLRLR
jgi:hypothetical protein